MEIPERMQHAIARQAEAERERRAKIINAEAEFQAAAKLADAADVIARNPTTIQLRYLQTLREIGGSQNSTIVFPMPVDLMRPVIEALGKGTGHGTAEPEPAGEQRPAELQPGSSRTEALAEANAASSLTEANAASSLTEGNAASLLTSRELGVPSVPDNGHTDP